MRPITDTRLRLETDELNMLTESEKKSERVHRAPHSFSPCFFLLLGLLLSELVDEPINKTGSRLGSLRDAIFRWAGGG